MSEGEDHGYCCITNDGVWSTNVVTSKTSKDKLAVAQLSMERAMLGMTIKDKIRHER